MSDFKHIQHQWAQWLRDPDNAPPPQVDPVRLQVYQRLVNNNIESFIERGFPVLVAVLSAQQWQKLIHDFIKQHHAQSPLFADIGNEFVQFLSEYKPEGYPQFMYELACYERMEVTAFNVAESCQLPALTAVDATTWRVNPSLQWRDFSFPVHTISAEHQPHASLEQPLFIAVFRQDSIDGKQNISSTVKFMQLNPVTMLLIDLLQQQPGLTVGQMATLLAEQLPQFSVQQLEQGLQTTVPDLYQRAMLFPSAI